MDYYNIAVVYSGFYHALALNPKHEYFSIVCTFKEVLGHDIVFLDVLHGKDGYARSYIADQRHGLHVRVYGAVICTLRQRYAALL